jgi:hypothetical protein
MRIVYSFFLAAIVAVAALSGAQPLQAAESACKGLVSDACAKNEACSWVDAYKTKKGKQIAAFCRKKPAKSAAKPAKPAS